MLSESQSGTAADSARELLFNLKDWQKAQSLFAEIIDANLCFIQSSTHFFNVPSPVNSFCQLFSDSYSSNSHQLPVCISEAHDHWIKKKETSFQCVHSLHYFLSPILSKDDSSAAAVLGPVIFGKRNEDSAYVDLCRKIGFDEQLFLDRIREIKVFTPHRIQTVMEYLRESSQLLINFITVLQQYQNHVAQLLLDLGSEYIGADSGSVLLVDGSKNCLRIESSKGLQETIVQKKFLPIEGGIADWVIKTKKSVLITPDIKDETFKSKLKRPQLKSSMLIPLEHDNKAFGVFCLSTKKENDRFNEENLSFLNNLTKFTVSAFFLPTVN